jgi:hypothetical protein
VELRITDCWGGATAGRVIGFDAGSWRIGLHTYLSPKQASRTLWHELIHIAQAQQTGGLDELDIRVMNELRTARLFGTGQRRFLRGWAYPFVRIRARARDQKATGGVQRPPRLQPRLVAVIVTVCNLLNAGHRPSTAGSEWSLGELMMAEAGEGMRLCAGTASAGAEPAPVVCGQRSSRSSP